MIKTHDTIQFGPSRQREHDLLSLLARTVIYGAGLSGIESRQELRQMGYGADLASGRVDDPDCNLDNLAFKCHQKLAGSQIPDHNYRDPVQQWWGAAWNMDIGKIKSELSGYINCIKNEMNDAPDL